MPHVIFMKKKKKIYASRTQMDASVIARTYKSSKYWLKKYVIKLNKINLKKYNNNLIYWYEHSTSS